jgi:maltose alpha-D-glucosyltransferase/alpha-amylase
VEKWATDGDYRWINRGGVDLLGDNPNAKVSAFGLPRAPALYGPVPQQLKDPNSFVSSLKRLLAARKKYRIAEGELLAAPEVKNRGSCILVMRMPGQPTLAVTALNFGESMVKEQIDLPKIKSIKLDEVRGRSARDVIAGTREGNVSDNGVLTVELPAWTGKTFVLEQ